MLAITTASSARYFDAIKRNVSFSNEFETKTTDEVEGDKNTLLFPLLLITTQGAGGIFRSEQLFLQQCCWLSARHEC